MDYDNNRLLTPKELQDFVSSERGDGRDVMSGQLVLPSGQCLSLGVLVDVIRRQKVLDAVFKARELEYICTQASRC